MQFNSPGFENDEICRLYVSLRMADFKKINLPPIFLDYIIFSAFIAENSHTWDHGLCWLCFQENITHEAK